MAAPGWYPDPDGTPGRFRYWDGRQWSSETAQDPAAGAPTGAVPSGDPTHRAQRSRRPARAGWIIAAVLVLVTVVIASLVVRSLNSHRDSAINDPDPPRPSVSGWDDSSPFPTASPPPTGDSATPPGREACAAGAPSEHRSHPHDDRIHGGQLSIRQPDPPWRRNDSYAAGLSYAYDVSGAQEQVEPRWYALLAVGEVRAEDGFTEPKQAADGIVQCMASSFYYRHFTGRKDLISKKFTLQGHTGWTIRTEIRVDEPDIEATGDVVQVIVLDTDERGSLSVFAGGVPIDDRTRLKLLESVIADMTVD